MGGVEGNLTTVRTAEDLIEVNGDAATFRNGEIITYGRMKMVRLAFTLIGEWKDNTNIFVGTLKIPHRPLITTGFSHDWLSGFITVDGNLYARNHLGKDANIGGNFEILASYLNRFT